MLKAEVTKENVSLRRDRFYCEFRLTIFDDANILLDIVVSEPYEPGEDRAITVGRFKGQFQKFIDSFVSEQNVKNDTALDDIASLIESELKI